MSPLHPRIVIYSLRSDDGSLWYELELHRRNEPAVSIGTAFDRIGVIALLADFLAGGITEAEVPLPLLAYPFADRVAEEYRREQSRSGKQVT